MMALFAFWLGCNVIHIYNDEGVGPDSLEQAVHTFKTLFPKCHVKKLNAEQVKAGDWLKNTSLFVMPGGADVPYTKKLNGIGNENIRRYVEQGGTYLGFCAGAYYGASYIEFDEGGPDQVIGPRQLKFFPGTEIGPALAPYDDKNNSGARVSNLNLASGATLPAFVNGGGYFKDAHLLPHVEVLAWYPEPVKEAAIVKMAVGKGVALLSGAHLEYDPKLLNPKDPYLAPLIPELLRVNTQRLEWLQNHVKAASSDKYNRQDFSANNPGDILQPL